MQARAPKAKPIRKRQRRTDREILLDAITRLSENGAKMISNAAVVDDLKWEEGKYKRLKEQLHRENLILKGRGQGGSVGFAEVPGGHSLRIFISYSHVDEQMKDDLLKHLKPLKRQNLIEDWHDRKLKAGDNWAGEISKNLENADIILLLVSIDFINSDYCYGIELDEAMRQHETGEAVVVPIIIRNCLWQSTPFATIQALPKDAKPIKSWANLDDAFVNVAEGIQRVAKNLIS